MAEVSGLDEFAAFARESAHDLQDALPAIVLEAAALVEDEIRVRAPEASGELKAHLDAIARGRQNSASATVEINDSGPGGVEHYAIFQEYGTSRMAPNPFFRPGVEAARAPGEGLVERRIDEVLSRRDR